MFHWVGSLIKKGRQKIAELSPQKLFHSIHSSFSSN
jgi:hypothetical protein